MTHPAPKGYTLVELLVSLSIFAIVMLSATAAYLSFISYNRTAQTTATIVNSVSFAIDSMARDIRTGTGYTCPGNYCAPTGVTSFSFVNSDGCNVTYSTSSGAITRTSSGTGCTVETNAAMTDPALSVASLLFYVRGTSGSSDPSDQPMVSIVIQGQGTVPNSYNPNTHAPIVIPFNIETGATMRVPDL